MNFKFLISFTFFLCFWSESSLAQDSPHKIIKHGKYFGVLSLEGDTLIPFKYSKIYFIRNSYYQVQLDREKKDPLYGVYDLTGKQIVRPIYTGIYINEYDSIISCHSPKETVTYFINKDRNVKHEGIFSVRRWGGHSNVPSMYLFTSEKNGSEILDSNLNTVFKSKEYIIGPFRFTGEKKEIIEYMYGPYGKGKYGLINSSHEVIIPPMYDDLQTPNEYWVNYGTGNEIIARNSKTYDYYPGNGSKAVYHYDFMEFWNGYRTAKEGGTWKLIDENNNVVHSDKKYALSFRTDHFNPVDFDYRETWCEGCTFNQDYLMSQLNPNDNILFRVSHGTKHRKYMVFGGSIIKKYAEFGLVNYRTKAETKVKYNFIHGAKRWSYNGPYSGNRYFWAIKHDQIANTILLDVYDSNLRIVHSHHLSDSSLHFIKSRFYSKKDSVAQVVQNSENKFGLLAPDGSIKVPFTYSRHRIVHSWYHSNESYHLLGDKSHYTIFNSQGKQYTSMVFDTVYFLDHHYEHILIGKKGDHFTWMNTKTRETTDGITRHFRGRYIKRPRESIGYYGGKSFYIVKDNHLYVWDNEGFVLMDETRIEFKESTQKLFYNVEIDKSGKLVDR